MTRFQIDRALLCALVLIGGALAAPTPRPAPGGIVRVFVLAGSSNALGYGADAFLLPPELSGPQADVRFWYEDGVGTGGPWVTSGGTLVPLQRQPNDPAGIVFGPFSGPALVMGFGPEIAGGRALADEAGPVAIVKVASDGSSLAKDWHPDQSGLWERLTDAVTGAERQLAEAGRTPVLSGFFLMQGEVDAITEDQARKYERNLTHFITRTRQRLDAPELPFVIGRPSSRIACGPFGCFPWLSEVRAAQVAVAGTLSGVVIVDTDDLLLQPDGAHFTAASQLLLGLRFANTWLSLQD
jgi:hypothetical protein